MDGNRDGALETNCLRNLVLPGQGSRHRVFMGRDRSEPFVAGPTSHTPRLYLNTEASGVRHSS